MEIREIEIYSDAPNYVIVRTPGRNYPGCVIQGDSLAILLDRASEVCSLVRSSGNQDLIEEAEDLEQALKERLDDYEVVLKAHGFDLPYARRPRT